VRQTRRPDGLADELAWWGLIVVDDKYHFLYGRRFPPIAMNPALAPLPVARGLGSSGGAERWDRTTGRAA